VLTTISLNAQHRVLEHFWCVSIGTLCGTKFDFHDAFACDAALAALPDHLRATLPIVGFKYPDPLGRMWCNYGTVAKQASLTPAAVAQILASPCVCERGHPSNNWYHRRGFVCANHKHVVSGDPEVLRGFPEPLKHLFTAGAKHRPDVVRVVMSPAIRQQVLLEMKASLAAFVEKNGDGWARWSAAVESALSAQLQGSAFDDGVVFANDSKPHEPGTRFEPFLDSYRSKINTLHRDFVVTVADKVSNNLVVVCKKFYIQKLCEDLANTAFYSPVLPADGTQPAIAVPEALWSKLRGEYREVRTNMYSHCGLSVSDLRTELSVVPFGAALVKLHKDPIALRFLACSGANGLKLPAQWLTALLRSLRPDLKGLWEDLFRPLDLNDVMCPP
jgi:hypothetical protein